MKSKLRILSRVCACTVLLLGAAGALAAPEPAPPLVCTTNPTDGIGSGNWTVTVTAGPCRVSCTSNNTSMPFCDPNGACTGIEYTVTKNSNMNADHTVTLVPELATVVYTPGLVYAPCVGDPVTNLGKWACHERAVRLNDNSSVYRYRLVVAGHKSPVWTSVAVKKGNTIESCRIAGLGREPFGDVDSTSCVPSCGGFHPKQTVTVSEEKTFNKCTVKFNFSPVTGEVVSAVLTPESLADGCDFATFPISSLELKMSDGTTLGMGSFGSGYLNTGSDSCCTYYYGGTVYRWGKPCP